MKGSKILFFVFIISFVFSCEKSDDTSPDLVNEVKTCEQLAKEKGWLIQEDGTKYLYGGGAESESRFNISNFMLKPCQLASALGREKIQALIDPEYVMLEEIQDIFIPTNKFIVLEQNDGLPKAYPLDLMVTHEIINEVINGEPVMIAYCVLADLGAVYTRNYCGNELTFALSGYTYHDENVWDGVNAFVLWDRETESLWWPLTDQAVSGEMSNTRLEKFSEGWLDMTFEEIQATYGTDNILVLEYGQTMEAPKDWPRLNIDGC